MRRTVAAALCAAVLACGDDPFGPADFRDLHRAEQRWAARNVSSYTFQIRRFCFCPPEYTEWSTIRVENDVVAGVVVGDTMPMAADRLDEWPTVDGLFQQIRGAAGGSGIADINVDYHDDLGYPVRIEVHAAENIVDGGYTVETRYLNPQP